MKTIPETSHPTPGEERHQPPSPERASVADAMHHGVLSCPPETPLKVVARMMATHRIHCVVVLGDPKTYFDRGVWRIVSDLDLVRASGPGWHERTAGDAATTPAVTVSPDDPLLQAAALMGEHGAAHLVVSDAASRPVGILSTLDVAAALAWGRGGPAGG